MILFIGYVINSHIPFFRHDFGLSNHVSSCQLGYLKSQSDLIFVLKLVCNIYILFFHSGVYVVSSVVFLQKPYLQVRENNWTINADFSGNWSVVYDL